jgi:pSer/pThr/pTyr-binding forkhead associated (FHA) protein
MKQLARRQAETMGWPILEPVDAEGVERPVALSTEVCVAGARDHVNLKLSSRRVSRTHALFVTDRDSIYLRDLASRNHTYLNDEPIREAVLRNGDLIGLGPLTFRCQSGFDRPYEQGETHAPPAELRLESDDSRHPLPGRTALIGSRTDCDILLRGDEVDPAHAVIYEREGRRFIRDLQPHSDTLVNDQPVKEVELQPGDRIRIGESNLVYQIVPRVENNAAPLPLLEDLDVENGDGNGPADTTIPMDDLPQDDPLLASPTEEPPAAVDEVSLSEPTETETDAPLALAESADEDVTPFPLESTQTDELREAVSPAAPAEEMELDPAAPVVAAIEELDSEPSASAMEEALEPAIVRPDQPIDANASLSPEPEPPIPADAPRHAPAEEKLTELLGELVETVSKVQETWKEIRSGSNDQTENSHEHLANETIH